MIGRESGTHVSLIDEIVSVPNLTRAWEKVRSNIRVAQRDRSRGVDNITILDFETEWATHMERLALDLRSGQYRPLPPKHLLIGKTGGGERAIAILAVRDRIAQRAVLQVLEPLVEPTFLDCSYGFRSYVGVPHALARVERYRQQGLRWAAHADVADCFGTIDHRILLDLVERRVRDRAVVTLVAEWLRAGVLSEVATTDASQWWDDGEQLWEKFTTVAMDIADGGSVGMNDGMDYNAGFVPPAERSSHLRRRALQGLMSNAALWSLTYGKAVMSGVRRAAPLVKRIPGGAATLGAASLAALALVPLATRARRERERGALQGGALSPLLANIYLDPFDRAMVQRGHSVVRFADDFLVLGASDAAVTAALRDAEVILGKLRMATNPQKTQQGTFDDGLVFLGHRFVPAPPKSNERAASFAEVQQRLRQSVQRKKGKQHKK